MEDILKEAWKALMSSHAASVVLAVLVLILQSIAMIVYWGILELGEWSFSHPFAFGAVSFLAALLSYAGLLAAADNAIRRKYQGQIAESTNRAVIAEDRIEAMNAILLVAYGKRLLPKISGERDLEWKAIDPTAPTLPGVAPIPLGRVGDSATLQQSSVAPQQANCQEKQRG